MRKLPEHSDLTLFSLLKAGDESAFDEIFNRYWDKLYNYAFHRTPVKDVAFEIVQDIFVSLWARREVVELQSSLSGYLFAAVRFQLINYIKNSQLKEQYLDDYQRFLSSADNSNEESVLVRDLQLALERSITDLPARCQEITRLSMLEHWSVEQIATRLNVSTRTVENQLTIARKYLRTSLGEFLTICLLIRVL